MKNTQETLYCYNCKKNVTCHHEPVDHKKQLRTTLFTFGFWLPIWLLMTLVKSTVCDICGTPLTRDE